MKRTIMAAAACGVLVLVAAVAAPAGAQRGMFAGLFAPVLLAVAVPFGMPAERDLRRDAIFVLAAAGFSALALFFFLLKTPGAGPALGLVFFHFTWIVLVAGTFRAATRLGLPLALLAAPGLALLACSSHLLADPLVTSVEKNAPLREFLIGAVINTNPSLVASAAFWGTDPLHSSYGYARSSIGSYYAYTYAAWWKVAGAYLAIGAILWACSPRPEVPDEDPSPEPLE